MDVHTLHSLVVELESLGYGPEGYSVVSLGSGPVRGIRVDHLTRTIALVAASGGAQDQAVSYSLTLDEALASLARYAL